MIAPLELLYERAGLSSFELPEELARGYRGGFGLAGPRVYGNFVASVDGVVALPDEVESGGVISQGSEADRFVMGLLRACADAVLIGAGTFRKTPGHVWDAAHIYPGATLAFAELRRKLGLHAIPRLVVVSASGRLDLAHPALRNDATIVTTAAGKALLEGKLPRTVSLTVVERGPIRLDGVLAALRAGGARNVLSEGGPTLIGQLIDEGLLDELFLTSSPLLLGRRPGDRRKALVEGVDLLGRAEAKLDLLSVRKSGSYLFLRYALRGKS